LVTQVLDNNVRLCYHYNSADDVGTILNLALSKGNKMANQSFKVAGITAHGTSIKVRFTDDLVRRVKQFSKGGASRIDLMELPSAMSKLEALAYLQAHADFQSQSDQATISDAIADRTKEANKGIVKVKVAKATKPSLDAIKARAKAKTKDVTVEQLLEVLGEASL